MMRYLGITGTHMAKISQCITLLVLFCLMSWFVIVCTNCWVCVCHWVYFSFESIFKAHLGTGNFLTQNICPRRLPWRHLVPQSLSQLCCRHNSKLQLKQLVRTCLQRGSVIMAQKSFFFNFFSLLEAKTLKRAFPV